jgi:hypothetical protein
MKANEACMARWSSECRLFAVASVALSCSACDAHAFALCEYCPDLYASTPIAYQAALPRRRVQSTPLHDRYASRWYRRRDDPLPPRLVFGAETVGSAALQSIDGGGRSATIPAVRIDEFFNLMSVGESDQPEQVVALRASVLARLPIGQVLPSPSGRTGFFFSALIAFGSSLLIGAALIAGRCGFATSPTRRAASPKDGGRETRQYVRGCSGEQVVIPQIWSMLGGILPGCWRRGGPHSCPNE